MNNSRYWLVAIISSADQRFSQIYRSAGTIPTLHHVIFHQINLSPLTCIKLSRPLHSNSFKCPTGSLPRRHRDLSSTYFPSEDRYLNSLHSRIHPFPSIDRLSSNTSRLVLFFFKWRPSRFGAGFYYSKWIPSSFFHTTSNWRHVLDQNWRPLCWRRSWAFW